MNRKRFPAEINAIRSVELIPDIGFVNVKPTPQVDETFDTFDEGFSFVFNINGAAVAEGIEWSSSNLKVGSSIPSLPKSACRSVFEQDAEPRIVPLRTTKCCQ